MRGSRVLGLDVSWVVVALAIWTAPIALAQDERPPRLDPPELQNANEPSGDSYRATGIDPAGPRTLVLWRWHENGFTRLDSTRSGPDGRFDFGEQPLPAVETWFHVAALGVDPAREHLVRVERRLRAPRVLSAGPASPSILLVPTEGGGELRIYDATNGRLILRWAIGGPEGASDSLDLLDELPVPRPPAIEIEQVLDDGRRSERAYWRID